MASAGSTIFGNLPIIFAVGVAINLPLGYWLSNHVFDAYWRSLGA